MLEVELKNMNFWVEGFNEFINQEIKRFDKIYLGLAHMHMNYNESNMSLLTKIPKLKAADFLTIPLHITFYFREDRPWTSSLLEDFVILIFKRFKIYNSVASIFIRRQNRKINKIEEIISAKIENVKFTAIGLGKAVGLSDKICDLRCMSFSEVTQNKWWELLSRTHILIGMHGSSMLIPSSFTLSFINLLPRYKIVNHAEDIAMGNSTPNILLFSRFLDIYSTPKLVSSHALAILSNFKRWIKEADLNHKVWKNSDEIFKHFN